MRTFGGGTMSHESRDKALAAMNDLPAEVARWRARCATLRNEKAALIAEVARLREAYNELFRITEARQLDAYLENKRLTAENARLRERIDDLDANIDYTADW